MSMGIYSAVSALKVKDMELDVVAHNIANANTNGFKEQQVSFKAVMARNGRNRSRVSTPFVQFSKRSINFNMGSLAHTGNSLDVALQGDGFLEVKHDGGTFYTRNGSLALNAAGNLVTQNGDLVMGEGGPIQVGSGGIINISKRGLISVDGVERGRIKLVRFQDPQKLEVAGATLFRGGEKAQLMPDTETQVLQGNVEMSNTDVVKNLVHLIEISRQFESYQKVLSANMQLERNANQMARLS